MKIAIKSRWQWIHTPCWEGEIEDQRNDTKNLGAAIIAAHRTGADLRGADLGDANLGGADLGGNLKVKTARVYTGLYRYVSMAILAFDGTPWVRMGCLWKTVEEWDRIGIRASNVGEFPDDGSEQCEERERAFAFARAAALRLAELNQKVEA